MLGMSTGLLWGKGLQWAYGVNSEWNKIDMASRKHKRVIEHMKKKEVYSQNIHYIKKMSANKN